MRDIHLSQPPRDVPGLLKIQVLFGGTLNQLGWFFLGFGLVFVWIFGAFAGLIEMARFYGHTQFAEGQVIAIAETNASENDRTIYEARYQYVVDGTLREGSGYGTSLPFDEGAAVEVEFLSKDPSISRIPGVRTSQFGLFGLFTVLFPIIGFFFVLGGLRKGIKAKRLLRVGQLAHGKLVDKEATATRVNKRTVYKMTFEFRDDRGMMQRTSTRTHEPEHLEDEEEESLLFDPQQPDSAVMLDGLPGQPIAGASGDWEVKSPGGALVALVVPIGAIAICGFTALSVVMSIL